MSGSTVYTIPITEEEKALLRLAQPQLSDIPGSLPAFGTGEDALQEYALAIMKMLVMAARVVLINQARTRAISDITDADLIAMAETWQPADAPPE